jgi:hypothetical protein
MKSVSECERQAPKHIRGRFLVNEKTASDLRQWSELQSGRQDLNLRPLDPQQAKGGDGPSTQSRTRRSGLIPSTLYDARCHLMTTNP